jgi:glycosyltransferase involved in cell wall biosynthesis
MRVWLLTTSEPTDASGNRLMRAGLLGEQLHARGHELDWWTAAFDHHSKRYLASRSETRLTAPCRRVHFLHTRVFYRKNVGVARIVNHRRVASEFLRNAARADRPDVIVCSYPTIEMAAAAIRYARPRRVPVIVDVRDRWPDIFSSIFPPALRKLGVDTLMLAPWNRQKAQIFAAASAITAVSPAYLEWARACVAGGYRGDTRVFPLAYPKLAGLDRARANAAQARAKLGLAADDLVIWFVGSFGRTYDLVPALTVARRFHAEGRKVRFVLSGEGEMRAQWEVLARGLDNVTFTGWLGEEELTQIAAVAAVGLLAYRSGAPQGLPNKLFECLSLGIPVVSSLDGECRSFVESHGIGYYYDAERPEELAGALDELCRDAERRRAIGAAAAALYGREFDSGVVYRQFAEYIEDVATASKCAEHGPSRASSVDAPVPTSRPS